MYIHTYSESKSLILAEFVGFYVIAYYGFESISRSIKASSWISSPSAIVRHTIPSWARYYFRCTLLMFDMNKDSIEWLLH